MASRDAKDDFVYPAHKPMVPELPLPIFVGSPSDLEQITREAVKGSYQVVGITGVAYSLLRQQISHMVATNATRPEEEQRYLAPLSENLAMTAYDGVTEIVEQASSRIRALGSAEAAMNTREGRGGFFQSLWGEDPKPAGKKSALRSLWEDW